MRRALLLVLGFGVFAGFGSAFAHARHHWAVDRGYTSGCDHWGGGERFMEPRVSERPAPVVAPASAPVVVQAAPAAAPSQVFIIMPGASSNAVPAVVAAPVAPAAVPQTVTGVPNGQ